MSEPVQQQQQVQQDQQQQQQNFFQSIYNQTSKLPQNLYQYSPIKSEYVVKKAQSLDNNMNNAVHSLDDKFQKALMRYQEKKEALADVISSNRTIVKKKLLESPVYRKSNELQIQVLDSLQNQLALFYKQFLQNHPKYASELKMYGKDGEVYPQMSEEEKQNLIKRYKNLIDNVNFVSQDIYELYIVLLQQYPTIQKLNSLRGNVKAFYETLSETLVQDIATPVYNNLGNPAVQSCFQYRERLENFSNQQKLLMINYYNTQRALLQQQITQIIKFAQEDRNQQVETVKLYFNKAINYRDEKIQQILSKYQVLKQGSVRFYDNYIQINFFKDYFQQSKEKIIKQLSELRNTLQNYDYKQALEQGKVKFNTAKLQAEIKFDGIKDSIKNRYNDTKQSTDNFYNNSKNIYQNALQKYQKKKSTLTQNVQL